MYNNIETKRSSFVAKMFFFMLGAISMVLTALFFARYMEFELLNRFHPVAGLVFSVLMGLLAADLGAILWIQIYLKHCRSSEQVNLALAGVVITVIMSVATTVMAIAEIFTGADLIPDNWMTWVGLLVIFVLASEFLLVLLFKLYDPDSKMQREITSAMTTDQAALGRELQAKLNATRALRVGELASDLEVHADGDIRRKLSIDGRGTSGSAAALPSAAPAVAHFQVLPDDGMALEDADPNP